MENLTAQHGALVAKRAAAAQAHNEAGREFGWGSWQEENALVAWDRAAEAVGQFETRNPGPWF